VGINSATSSFQSSGNTADRTRSSLLVVLITDSRFSKRKVHLLDDLEVAK
jgi:hypothetical protein